MKLPNVYWEEIAVVFTFDPWPGMGDTGKDLPRSEAGEIGGRWKPQSREEPSAGERDLEVGVTTSQVS